MGTLPGGGLAKESQCGEDYWTDPRQMDILGQVLHSTAAHTIQLDSVAFSSSPHQSAQLGSRSEQYVRFVFPCWRHSYSFSVHRQQTTCYSCLEGGPLASTQNRESKGRSLLVLELKCIASGLIQLSHQEHHLIGATVLFQHAPRSHPVHRFTQHHLC